MDIKKNCLDAAHCAGDCIKNPYMWRSSVSMKNSVYRKKEPGKDVWSSSFSKTGSVSLVVVAGIVAAVVFAACIAVKIKKMMR